MTNNNDQQPLPLEGLRVLDATHIVAGPFCAMILGDMGAEVIKIERPGSGEQGRRNQPFISRPDGQRVSARYLGLNRNKKSIALDLRDDRCKQVFENMVKVSDVFIGRGQTIVFTKERTLQSRWRVFHCSDLLTVVDLFRHLLQGYAWKLSTHHKEPMVSGQ